VDKATVYQIVSSDGSSTDEIRHVQIRGVAIACKAPLGWKLCEACLANLSAW